MFYWLLFYITWTAYYFSDHFFDEIINPYFDNTLTPYGHYQLNTKKISLHDYPNV